jgi:hypothetical protein
LVAHLLPIWTCATSTGGSRSDGNRHRGVD